MDSCVIEPPSPESSDDVTHSSPVDDLGLDTDNGKETTPRDSSILTLNPYIPTPNPSGNLSEGKPKNRPLSWKRSTLEELFSPSKRSQYISEEKFVGC